MTLELIFVIIILVVILGIVIMWNHSSTKLPKTSNVQYSNAILGSPCASGSSAINLPQFFQYPNCDLGYTCVNGICLSNIGSPCVSLNDCVIEASVCLAGICENSSSYLNINCSSNNDCSNLICDSILNVCKYPVLSSGCTKDSDCQSSDAYNETMCINSICYSAMPPGTSSKTIPCMTGYSYSKQGYCTNIGASTPLGGQSDICVYNVQGCQSGLECLSSANVYQYIINNFNFTPDEIINFSSNAGICSIEISQIGDSCNDDNSCALPGICIYQNITQEEFINQSVNGVCSPNFNTAVCILGQCTSDSECMNGECLSSSICLQDSDCASLNCSSDKFIEKFTTSWEKDTSFSSFSQSYQNIQFMFFNSTEYILLSNTDYNNFIVAQNNNTYIQYNLYINLLPCVASMLQPQRTYGVTIFIYNLFTFRRNCFVWFTCLGVSDTNTLYNEFGQLNLPSTYLESSILNIYAFSNEIDSSNYSYFAYISQGILFIIPYRDSSPGNIGSDEVLINNEWYVYKYFYYNSINTTDIIGMTFIEPFSTYTIGLNVFYNNAESFIINYTFKPLYNNSGVITREDSGSLPSPINVCPLSPYITIDSLIVNKCSLLYAIESVNVGVWNIPITLVSINQIYYRSQGYNIGDRAIYYINAVVSPIVGTTFNQLFEISINYQSIFNPITIVPFTSSTNSLITLAGECS